MELLGKEVKIEISEPWPKYEILTGRITMFFETKSQRQYIVIHNDAKNENYLVNNRYDYKLDTLRPKNDLMVNVVKIISVDPVNLINIDWDRLDKADWMNYTEIIGIGVLKLNTS